MMMFSDFPPPEDFPPFLTHRKVLEYFRLYAKRFDLLRHIRFGSEVTLVTKCEDYDASGRWRVEHTSISDGKVVQAAEVFDGVMVCNGHHSVPYVPEIPGLDNFKGLVMHSHSYKDAGLFHGKRVVILGLGNSAADIACDLARGSEQVYLSSRRGAWIVPRTAFWGLPADMLANSRVVFSLPLRLLDWCVQIQANFRIDHDTYGLRPKHGVLNCHPTINDELPIHLVSGRVLTRSKISRVEESGVWFHDDNVFCPCDAIILATGYDYRVDFVAPDAVQVVNNRTRLYKYVFPPHLSHPTLAMIGLIQAIGAVMPIAEMQCRWYTKLVKGERQLPSRRMMEDDISKKEDSMKKLYLGSRRHTLQTFWIAYMDEVASQIGARPNLWKIVCTDPELALKCYLGPCLPAQYRLVGPGTWKDARTFIVNAFARATRSRSSRLCKRSSSTTISAIHGDAGPQEYCAGSINTMVALNNTGIKTAGTVLTGHTSRRHRRRLLSPEWATMSFYVIILLACCLVWVMGVMLDQAGFRMSYVKTVTGTRSWGSC
ncbi:unnamed protein product [Lymnaea stagnalis]|uniref:Flavin-containing monooxygenase n=1 Tax=Lymnaea stagnalis TaxID=6523 RepID=A0AAV2IER9_LYMST